MRKDLLSEKDIVKLNIPNVGNKGRRDKKMKKRAKEFNLPLYLALLSLFLGVIGLCSFIKLQDFSVTITFPPMLVAFVVAVVGLSALYVVFKSTKKG